LKDSKQEKQNNSFVFNKDVKIAFCTLIAAFTQASILAHFDSNNYICVKIDVSEFAIATILSQLIYFANNTD